MNVQETHALETKVQEGFKILNASSREATAKNHRDMVKSWLSDLRDLADAGSGRVPVFLKDMMEVKPQKSNGLFPAFIETAAYAVSVIELTDVQAKNLAVAIAASKRSNIFNAGALLDTLVDQAGPSPSLAFALGDFLSRKVGAKELQEIYADAAVQSSGEKHADILTDKTCVMMLSEVRKLLEQRRPDAASVYCRKAGEWAETSPSFSALRDDIVSITKNPGGAGAFDVRFTRR